MALFKTTAEFAKYVKIDINMKFDKLKPYIDDAQEKYLTPLLGEQFYQEIVNFYDGVTPPPRADNDLVMPYIQRTLTFYSLFVMGDDMGVNIGDLGIQQSFNLNSQPAPYNKVANLKWKYIVTADRTADSLLEYLEANASLTKYAAWFNDPKANTAKSGLIVYKTSIASRYIDINESRRVYLRLRKRIRDIETTYIKRLLCADQYDEIIAQLQSGNVSDANQTLIDKLAPYISKKALFLSLPSLTISVEPEGLMIYSSNDSVVSKEAASIEEKKILAASLKEGDFGFAHDEQEIISFLNANIETYPLIKNSECWASNPASQGNSTTQWRGLNAPCFKHYSA
jgi:hypothetical protein